MDNFVLLLLFIVLFMVAEIIFFVICYRWLSNTKRTREKEFARLDSERNELLKLQAALRRDVEEGKTLADETLKKLRVLGSDAHGEWLEMKNNLQLLIQEFEEASKNSLDSRLETLTKYKLSLEKTIQEAKVCEKNLLAELHDVERILKFFDRSIPVEQIIQELHTEKCNDAKKMLASGADAQAVAKKFKLSMNEVALLSHIR